MRVRSPEPFSLSFVGPEGPYALRFTPIDEWDGVLDVVLGGQSFRWSVDSIDLAENGELTFSGMTVGTEALWGDQFWFAVRKQPEPSTVTYYGDRVVWRTDEAGGDAR